MDRNTPLPLQIRIRKDQRHRILPLGPARAIPSRHHRIHLFLALASRTKDAVLGAEKLADEGNVAAPIVAVVRDENGGDVGFGKVVFLVGRLSMACARLRQGLTSMYS